MQAPLLSLLALALWPASVTAMPWQVDSDFSREGLCEHIMTSIPALIEVNERRWRDAVPTRAFGSVAKRLVEAKLRYQGVSQKTGVPWFIIAVIHERESSQDWSTNIAQGDPWNRVSMHVPKGRGPFPSWEAAAYDALANCRPYAAKWTDWSPGGALTLLEQYNGLGYANKGLPSPYIWSGTNQYVRGKYVADGVFDPKAVDQQLGCAGLIQAMKELDPSISFGAPLPPPPDIETPVAEAPKPGKVGWLIALLAILTKFRKG